MTQACGTVVARAIAEMDVARRGLRLMHRSCGTGIRPDKQWEAFQCIGVLGAGRALLEPFARGGIRANVAFESDDPDNPAGTDQTLAGLSAAARTLSTLTEALEQEDEDKSDGDRLYEAVAAAKWIVDVMVDLIGCDIAHTPLWRGLKQSAVAAIA